MQRTQLALLVLVIFIYTKFTFATDDSIFIFDVKKTLRLKDSDPQYKDFYVNGGEEFGLKPGMLVSVYRKVAMYDNVRNKSAGDLKIYVGRLKIIHVQNGLSVARMYSRLSRKRLPVLDYESIMIGDKLDMNTVEMDRGKKKTSKTSRKRKKSNSSVAQVNTIEPQSEMSAEVKSVSLSSKVPAQGPLNVPPKM